MRRAVRALPVIVFGGLLGAVIAALGAAVAGPFLSRRVVEGVTAFEVGQITGVAGIIGAVLGAVVAVVAKVGAALLRQPTDPPPRKPPARLSVSMISGAFIGGFFAFSLMPVYKAAFGLHQGVRLLFTPGGFLAFALTFGFGFGASAAGFIVAFSPVVAPVHQRVRVRAQHLYEGPVTNAAELAVLINRIREGGEDALAAGKDFHLE